MTRRVILILALLIFVRVQNGYPLEGGCDITCPVVPKVSQPFVQRTIASKPDDFFVVLKNGLTLLIHSQPDSEIVSTQVFVKTGSIMEGKYFGAGLSHYLEHIVSGGSTRSFTEAQAKERLDRIGGSTNAYTSYDRTVYYINTAAEHWQDSLDLLLSYVSENLLDPNEIQREKAVIQQEMKLGENNPNSELWKLFIKTAYRENPVSVPVIGFEEAFVKQNRDALVDYYTERYQPQNMILVVSGNIDRNAVLEFVANKTKDFLPGKSEPVNVPAEPAQVSSRWEEKEVPISRVVQADIGFPSVTLYDRDAFALDVLAQLLGEGETCRLYCRLKDESNKVLSIGATNWTPDFVRGQFVVSVSLTPDQWPGVLKDIGEEIDGFKTSLVEQRDLDKAKKSNIAKHVFGQESVTARASSLASSLMSTGDPYFDDKYIEEIKKVTAEEVRSAAQRYLDMDRMNVAVIKPAAPGRDSAANEKVASAGNGAAPVAARDSSSAGFQQLPNGLKVLLKQDNSLPFVTVHLFGIGGLVLEDLEHPGISSLTASLLTDGTKSRTRLDISRTIEDAGGGIDSKSDNNTYHVSIKVLKEDLPTALDILADIAQNAQFPPEEIEKERQDTLIDIQRMDESWQAEVVRLFKKNYFLNSTYGNDKLGTLDSVKAITREDLLAFYHKMVSPAHSTLAIYGDIDPAAVSATVREKFGPWSGAAAQLAKLPTETAQVQADRTVEKKNEKSCPALFVGTNGIDITNAKKPVVEVLSAVLSGTGGPNGRLFHSLRGGNEDLVYVVGAFPFLAQKAGYFGVITQTTMGNLDKVRGVILTSLKKMAEEPVPAEELATIKEMMLVSRKLGRETLDAQAQSAALNEVLGLGWQYDLKSPDLIRSVTAEQIQELAKELFSHVLIATTLPERPVEILAAPPSARADTHIQ